MLLYHLTHCRKIDRILAEGLRPEYSRCARKCVYLADAVRVFTLDRHLAKRHGWRTDDLDILAVSVPWSQVEYHGNGIWYTFHLVPGFRIWSLEGLARLQ
jgi:hypothetical protein